MPRLPQPGADAGQWGEILNEYLLETHAADGTLKPSSVTNTAITDGAIQESKLHADVQTKLNATPTAPVTSVATKTGDVTLTKSDVGLSNVDNTSDSNKPISSATQTALDGKVNTSSVGAANGVATLDADTKLPEAQVPTRLGETELNATISTAMNARATAFGGLLVANSRPLVLGAVGDSTTTPWFGPFIDWLTPRIPHRTVTRRIWSDAKQGYPTVSILQTGLGGDRYIQGVGVNAYVSDSPGTSLSGDIDVRVKVALIDWSPASLVTMAAKNGSAGNRSWWFDAGSSNLQFTHSADGTNFTTQFSSSPISVVDGNEIWVRVTLDVDNGADGHTVRFYTSTNGSTWTQLGTDRVGAGVTSLFDATAVTQFPGRGGGGWPDATSRAYALRVLNGIDGPAVVDIDLDMLPHTATTFVDFCGNIANLTVPTAGVTRGGALGLAVLDGSLGGSSISYAADPTRFAKQIGAPADLGIINYGHTGGLTTPEDYFTTYQTIIDAFKAGSSYLALLGSIQNPQTTPRTQAQIDAHAARQNFIKTQMIESGYGVIDAYATFVADGRPMTELVPDGVHPSSEGYTMWTTLAKALFGPLT